MNSSGRHHCDETVSVFTCESTVLDIHQSKNVRFHLKDFGILARSDVPKTSQFDV